MPALVDLSPNSWLTLLGTCENIPNTFFEKIISGGESFVPWSTFRWTAYDNPFMADKWAVEIETLIKNNPKVAETSWFKTHYLNEWCSDDDLIIIPIDRGEIVSSVPKIKLNYLLSVDLGYDDASAFTIMGWSDADPSCYVVETFKSREMDFTDVANVIKGIQNRYVIDKILIDGANKQGVEEMRRRYGIPFQNAEKRDKATFLRMLRDDVIQGKLKVVGPKCGELITEWKQLQWKDDDRQDEDGRCQNHCSDSVLHGWRECRHYTFKEPLPEKTVDEKALLDEQREAEEMLNMDEIDSFMEG